MPAPVLFDRQKLRLRRRRHLVQSPSSFLRSEIVLRLVERLGDVKVELATMLDLGARGGEVGRALAEAELTPSLLVETELATNDALVRGRVLVMADEEWLPFGAARFDAVVSVMNLHTVNDLPGVLAQINYCLKPGGLLLAALPAGDTLSELRWALTQAELELVGGAAGRISPFIEIRDMGALLQRAGFELPMADLDRLTVTYGQPLELLDDLRRMGEAGVLAATTPVRPLQPAVVARMSEIYSSTFGLPNKRIPATFDILFATGWKRQPTSPKAPAHPA